MQNEETEKPTKQHAFQNNKSLCGKYIIENRTKYDEEKMDWERMCNTCFKIYKTLNEPVEIDFGDNSDVVAWEKYKELNPQSFEHSILKSPDYIKYLINRIESAFYAGFRQEKQAKPSFEHQLTSLINRHSMENGSDTPDFILGKYLLKCLRTFNETISEREVWYNRGRPSGDVDFLIGEVSSAVSNGNPDPIIRK